MLVTRYGDENIEFTSGAGVPDIIASTNPLGTGTVWHSLGGSPAISRDGTIVVFAGDRGNGPGVFAVVDEGTGFGDVLRVAGETTVDDNPYDALAGVANHELGYDAAGNGIYLAAIDLDAALGIERMSLNGDSFDDDCFVVTLVATPSSASVDNPALSISTPLLFSAEAGIWSVRVDSQSELNSLSPQRIFHPTSPIPVVQVGDSLHGAEILAVEPATPIAAAEYDPDGVPRDVRRGDHYLSFTATTGSGDQLVWAAHLDTDADGLLDHWERAGGGIDMDQDGSVDLDLSALGASSTHQDLFLEIDWLAAAADHRNEPAPLVTSELVAMFAQAPIDNPDGTTGIRLHIDAGSGADAAGLPFSQDMGSGSLQGGDSIAMPGDPTAHLDVVTFGAAPTVAGTTARSFQDIKDSYFGTADKRARELAFHYAVLADFYSYFPSNTAPLTGTVSGGTGTTVTVSGMPFASYSTADLRGHAVGVISAATGAMQVRSITARGSGSQVAVDAAWDTTPAAGDQFVLLAGNSGIAEAGFYADPDNQGVPGNDILLTLGGQGLTSYTDPTGTTFNLLGNGFIQWRTLAHELGHNLTLRHGGVTLDDTAVRADPFSYLSLMNYAHQLRAPLTGFVTAAGSTSLTAVGTPFGSTNYARFTVEIIAGAGIGQTNEVASNTSQVLTLAGPWTTTPDASSMFRLSTGVDSYSQDSDPTFADWTYIELDFQNAFGSLGRTSGDSLGSASTSSDEATWADYADLNGGDLDRTAPSVDIWQAPGKGSLEDGGTIAKTRNLTVYISAPDDDVAEAYALFDADGDGVVEADEMVAAEWNATTELFEATIQGLSGPVGRRDLQALVLDTSGNSATDLVEVEVTHDYAFLANLFTDLGQALQNALPEIRSRVAIPFLDDDLSDVVDLSSTFAQITDRLYDEQVVPELRFATLEEFETELGAVLASYTDSELPTGFDVDLAYAPDTDTVTFNFALNKLFTREVELSLDSGLDLGLAGSLDMAAIGDATFDAAVALSFGVGVYLGDLADGWRLDDSTLLSDLNAGEGVDILVGMTADNAAPGDGQLGADVTFTLDIQREDRSQDVVQPLTLHYAPSPTDPSRPASSDNDDVASLVSDLNLVLKAAGLEGIVQAETYTALDAAGHVTEQRLMLRGVATEAEGLSPIRALSIRGGEALGFGTDQGGNFADLSITVGEDAGTTYDVDLDGVRDLGDVIAAIEAQTRGDVTAEINGDGTGLSLSADGVITVSAAYTPTRFTSGGADSDDGLTSLAASGLGLLSGAVYGSLAGESLHGLSAADRVWLVENPAGNPNLSFTARVTASLDAGAAMGCLGLSLTTASPLSFTVIADTYLQDPNADDNRIYVSELTASPAAVVDMAGAAVEATAVGEIEVSSASLELGVTATGDDLLDQVAGGTAPALTLSVAGDSTSGFWFTADANFAELVTQFQGVCPATLLAVMSDLASGLEGSNWSILDTELPLLNQSLGKLLGFADGLVDAASRLVSEIDLPSVELALGDLDAAISNVSLAYDQRGRLFRMGELLWSVTSEPQRPVQDPDETDAQYRLRLGQYDDDLAEFELHLPRRLLSGLIQLARVIDVDVPAGTVGRADLVDAFNGLAALLPSWNSLADRLADTLNSALQDLGFAVTVQLGFVDYDGDEATEGAAVVAGLTLTRDLDQTFAPELPVTEDFGPLTLEGGASLRLGASGTLALGFGITLETTPETFVIVNPPANPDLVKTSLDVTAGFYGSSHGEMSLGSLDVVTADATLGLTNAVHETHTVSGGQIELNDTPLYDDAEFFFVADAAGLLDPGTDYTVRRDASGDWLVFTSRADGTEVSVDYQTVSVPGSSPDPANDAADRAHLAIAFDKTPGNAIGAIPLTSLFDPATVNATVTGMVTAALDVEFLGSRVEDGVQLAVELNHLTEPRLEVDTEALSSLFTSLDFDLTTILWGIEQLLGLIRDGLTTQVVTQLPLVGDGFNTAGTFVERLQTFVGDFRGELERYGGDTEGASLMVKTFIVDKLGDILVDVNSPAGIDIGDVDVVLDAEQFEIVFQLHGIETQTLDLDLGLDGLPISAEGQGGLEFGWEYDILFGVGVNREQGFYLVTNPTTEPDVPEYQFDLFAGLAVEDAGGEYIPTSLSLDLFGIQVSATDNASGSTPGTGLGGTLDLYLNSTSSGQLVPGDMDDVTFDQLFELVELNASAAVDLILEVGLNSNLPSLQTELVAGIEASASQVDGQWETSLTCTGLQLQNTGVNLGEFLSQHVGSVINRITQYLEPIEPVIRLLKTEVPGVTQLSEAAGKGSVTFLELALADNPDMAALAEEFVDALDTLLQIADSLETLDDGSTLFQLMDDLQLPTGEAGDEGWAEDVDVEQVVADSGGQTHSADESTGGIKSLLQQIEELGIHLHFLQIENIVRMLLGQPFDVISYELPYFELPFEFSQKFPVWTPPPISVEVGLNASIFADLSMGYDSHGLETGNFFDGFYFGDRESVFEGQDIDEFGLGVGVSLAALLDVVVASAGVEGEIRADVLANWRDLDSDGKIHLDELEQIVDCDGIACVFDLTGEVRALVSLVWDVLGAEGSHTFVDELLFSFQNTCPTYELGHVAVAGEELPDGNVSVAGTLILHAGAFAGQRGPASSSDVAEDFTVTETAPGVYTVEGLGLQSTYEGVTQIFFDGGAGNDALRLEDVTVSVVAYGGDGDDVLQGGTANDCLDGGSGNDTLTGWAGNDTLSGGSGEDELAGEDGEDVLYGDAGNDILDGGAGDDTGDGGDGDDLIQGRTEDDTLCGGSGNDQIFGGSGVDTLDGGPDDDVLLGEAGDDSINGGSGGDLISGGTGGDTLDGESGNDLIVGGLIDANGEQVTLITTAFGIDLGALDRDPETGSDAADSLWGGLGNDLLVGDAGGDSLDGSWGNDVLLAHLILDGSSADAEYIEGGPGDDFVCGSRGTDTIYGGTSSPEALAKVLAEEGGETFAGVQGFSCQATPTYTRAETGSVSGRVFLDQNADGVRDSDETGLAGWTVQVWDGEGALAASQLTSGDGTYTISGLAYGTYTIHQVLAGGYVQTAPAAGTHTLTLSAGGAVLDLDFGAQFQGATLWGYKFHDLNGNGVRDGGETTMNGWQIELLDASGNVVASTTTTSHDLDDDEVYDPATEHGVYSFSGVTPGTYTVRETPRTGWIQSLPVLSTGDSYTSDTGYAYQPIADDGFSPTRSTATASGLAGTLTDVNLTVDIEHVSLGQLTLYLLSPTGTRVELAAGVGGEEADFAGTTFDDSACLPIDDATATAPYSGSYRPQGALTDLFGEDPNGVWILVIQDTASGDSGRLNAWSLEITTTSGSATVTGGSPSPFAADRMIHYEVTVATGESLQRDFGNYRTGRVSGQKFTDLNGDHKRGADEAGMPYVTIYADLNDNRRLDRQEPFTITAADDPRTQQDEAGTFTLQALPPGDYVIREVLPPLTVQTVPAPLPGSTVSPGYAVNMRSGATVDSLVFGNQPLGEIRGVKWLDRDGDGLRESGEPGLAGVTIYVDLNRNGMLDASEPTAVTQNDNPRTVGVDETGQYTLTRLAVGQYTVREVVPLGFFQSFPDAAQLGQHTVDVKSQQVLRGIDFGNRPKDEGICGEKYQDRNGNGRREPDEPGLAGVTIYADLNQNGQWDADEPATVTQADDPATGQVNETGRYCLRGIDLGLVVVREVVPAGYKQTAGGREAVYAEDFDQPAGPGNPVGDEWSTDRVTVAPLSQRAFLGLFDNETVTLTLDGLPAHDTLYVAFDLIIAGSWNGDHLRQGPDRWQLQTGDGLTLLDTTFSNTSNAVPTWQNPSDGEDVDGSGYVTPLDVLMLINKINAGSSGALPAPTEKRPGVARYYDVSGEGQLNATDVLHVINRINGVSGGSTGTGQPLGAGQGDFFPQSFPDIYGRASHAPGTGAAETDLQGYDGRGLPPEVISYQPNDAVYHLSFIVPHNASSVVLDFQALGLANRDLDFEKWGLDNVVISVPSAAQTVRVQPGQTVTGIDFGNQPTGQPADKLDFGDALDPRYPTLLEHEGARHTIVAGVYLGEGVDAEADGQPTADSLGDDRVGDDEDGVRFLTPFVAGTPVQLEVTASTAGFLNAWADFNGDGDWQDEGEHFLADRTLNPGINAISAPMPLTDLPPEYLLTRFRFSTQAGLDFWGPAPDGEVEDYRVDMPGQNPANPPAPSAAAPPAASPATAGDPQTGGGQNGNEIHGVKWRDGNGDRQRQAGEPGLAGVTIYADLDDDGQLDAGEPSDVTYADDPATPQDELGTYGLVGLPNGTIIVREIVPANHVQTFPASGFHTIVFEVVHVAQDVNFGNRPVDPGQNVVEGVKWNDLTGDLGVRDAGDPGLAGVKIYVDLNGNSQWDANEPSTVTRDDDPATGVDETGQYKITNLPTGRFAVLEAVPSGWMQCYPATPYLVALTGASVISHLDFGNFQYRELPDGDDVVYAGEGDDWLYGDNVVTDPRIVSVGTRADTLYGEAGKDELRGQEMEDQLSGGADDDYLDGGDGTDRVLQTSDQEQILKDDSSLLYDAILTDGTSSKDSLDNIEHATLTGEAGDNRIDAAGFTFGSVLLIGAGGNDTLLGTAADDELQGGDGDDLLAGNAGNDRLDGGAGSDHYGGGPDDDHYLFASATAPEDDWITEDPGPGVDLLDFSALPATDVVQIDLTTTFSGRTTDRTLWFTNPQFLENITGGEGDDEIIGSIANNYIVGGSGADTLDGGLGNDILDGGLDDDRLTGGPGPSGTDPDDDTFLVSPDWGAAETVTDGGGSDTLDLSGLTAHLTIEVDAATGLSISDGTQLLTHAGNVIENLLGGRGDDRYLFHDGAALAGGSGRISDAAGTDWLDYSAYSTPVTVRLSTGAATGTAGVGGLENVVGGSAADVLEGDGHANELWGNAGDDLASGLDGDDVLDGGSGDDRLLGGRSNDVYRFGPASGSEADRVDEFMSEGGDTLDFSGLDTAVEVNLRSNTIATSPGRTVTVDTSGNWAFFERVLGTDGDDRFVPNGSQNRIAGGGGNDRYQILPAVLGSVALFEADSSSGGQDTIDFGGFTTGVTFDLNAAESTLASGLVVRLRDEAGNAAPWHFENLLGGSGDDVLTGNDLDNVLDGGDGDDTLAGRRGNDRLLGGAGDNWLAGGVGDDVYVLVDAATAGVTTLTEDAGSVGGGMLSPGGVDTIDLSALTTAVTFDLSVTTNTIGSLTIELLDASGAAASAYFEIVIGSLTQANALTGNDADNLLVGGMAADTLTGGGGRDILIGHFGNDVLIGDGGSGAADRDLLFGGYGADQLHGGDEEDLLAAGGLTYNHPLDRTALDALRTAWLSNQSCNARRTSLKAGVGVDSQYRLAADTYLADAAADQLYGDDGADWFLVDDFSEILDLQVGEESDRLGGGT